MEEAETRFRAVFESTYPVLVRYARRHGLSASDADDLVAETYEIAWRRVDAVPAGDEALPWLLGVSRNLLRNRRRRLWRDRSLLQRLGPPPEADMGLPTVSWQDIRRALDRLSGEDRELILLIAWDGLEPAQAATVLGLTPGAARTRLHRARGRMADLLGVERELPQPGTSGQDKRETATTGGPGDA
jgi:RNA polymerase sigma-70 factor, ECF subfamily